jgi:hypothetical protein
LLHPSVDAANDRTTVNIPGSREVTSTYPRNGPSQPSSS